MLREVKVLDQGFVRLVTWMPWNMPDIVDYVTDVISGVLVHQNDLGVVNAARVSFNKESRLLTKGDRGLIRFLAEHGHTSPFRHTMVTLEVQAPLMVARQWFKYRVGSIHSDDAEFGLTNVGQPTSSNSSAGNIIGPVNNDSICDMLEPMDIDSVKYMGLGNGDDGCGDGDPMYARNESSRRYVTEEPLFHTPAEWRSAPDNKKQGSGGPITDERTIELMLERLSETQRIGRINYKDAMNLGVCAEQARLFLPAYDMYLHWRWSASIPAICHFLNQRLGEGAQAEITQYAHAVYALVSQPEVYPLSVEQLTRRDDE